MFYKLFLDKSLIHIKIETCLKVRFFSSNCWHPKNIVINSSKKTLFIFISNVFEIVTRKILIQIKFFEFSTFLIFLPSQVFIYRACVFFFCVCVCVCASSSCVYNTLNVKRSLWTFWRTNLLKLEKKNARSAAFISFILEQYFSSLK